MSPLTLFVPLYFIGILIKGKSKKAGAVYDLFWSAGILIWSIGVYGQGGSVSLFGSIELPAPVFMLIIAGVMVSEVFGLIQAFREQPEPSEVPTQEQIEADGPTVHMDKPSTLYIVHTRGLIGTAAKIALTLNGRPIGELGNGAYLAVSTDAATNRLRASCSAFPNGTQIEFQAQSGGEARVNLELITGKGIVLSVADTVGFRQPQPGKKRVRPVKKGYVLWSITNFWAYFLGIIPLRMTLKAAKTPFDDVAEKKLRSAKKWNAWMTGILAAVVLSAVAIPRLMR